MVLSDVTVTTMQGLKDAIATADYGAVITLGKDIPDAVGIAVASGKNFTLDFAGHTYTLKDPGAGSPGTETNGFQLLKDSTITFKNGTVRIAPGQTNIKRIIQNYADLTLENMTFYTENQAGREDYALSFNNGTVTFKENTNVISSNSGVIAFDVCFWTPYYPDGVKVIFDKSYKGTITGKVLYDSTDSEKAELVINGSGNFGSIETTSTSCKNPNITIYGGTFENKNLPKEYLAEGWVQDSKGNVVSKETGIYQVSNEEELLKALNDGIKNIQLANDISLSKMLDITTDGVTLDGDGHQVKVDELNNKTNVFGISGQKDVTVKNLTITGNNTGKHGFNIYKSDNITLEDITVSGVAGLGIVVNASSVTATGNITLSNNGWGDGINVGFGKNITDRNGSSFDASAATLTGVTSVYTDEGDVKRAGGADQFDIKLPSNYQSQPTTKFPVCWVPVETPTPVPEDKPSKPSGSGSSTGSTGSGSSGGSSDIRTDKTNLPSVGSSREGVWDRVIDRIQSASKGSRLRINIGNHNTIPDSVLEALRQNPLTVTFYDADGQEVTLPAGQVPPSQYDEWTLRQLGNYLLAEPEETAEQPQAQEQPVASDTGKPNPATGAQDITAALAAAAVSLMGLVVLSKKR